MDITNSLNILLNMSNHSYTEVMNVQHEFTGEFQRNVIILICISILIITVNGTVISAFIIDRNIRQRPANVLICSQACIDLFTGIVYIPTFLLEASRRVNNVTLFLTCYMLFLSLFNLLALSTDRYLALSRPLLHRRMIDLRRTIKLVMLIWLIPLALTLIPITWWFQPAEFKHKADRIYLGIVWLFMLVLVAAMTVLYLFVTKKARRTIRFKRQSIANRSQTKTAALARKELRVVHLFGLLLFFFVAAYLPILYMNLCDFIGQVKYIPHVLEIIGFYSLLLNSVVNPILCIYLKKDYLLVITAVTCAKKVSRLRNLSKKLSFKTSDSDIEDYEGGECTKESYHFTEMSNIKPSNDNSSQNHERNNNDEKDLFIQNNSTS